MVCASPVMDIFSRHHSKLARANLIKSCSPGFSYQCSFHQTSTPDFGLTPRVSLLIPNIFNYPRLLRRRAFARTHTITRTECACEGYAINSTRNLPRNCGASSLVQRSKNAPFAVADQQIMARVRPTAAFQGIQRWCECQVFRRI